MKEAEMDETIGRILMLVFLFLIYLPFTIIAIVVYFRTAGRVKKILAVLIDIKDGLSKETPTSN
jgi:hypothetical protein